MVVVILEAAGTRDRPGRGRPGSLAPLRDPEIHQPAFARHRRAYAPPGMQTRVIADPVDTPRQARPRMNLRWLAPDWSSISTRLAGWFQLIALVPCVVLLLVTGFFSRQSLEATVRQRLTVISDAKASSLEAYIAERRNDALFLANAPGFVEALERLGALVREGKGDTEEYRREADTYRGRLTSLVEAKSLGNLSLFDLRGVPLVSYRPGLDYGESLLTGPLKGTQLAETFRKCQFLLMPMTTNFQVYPGREDPTGFVVGPILREGVLIGVVVIELDNEALFKSLRNYFGLGETGDTTVATEQGDGLVYVAPTRFDPKAAFRDQIRFGDERGKDMQQAVRGNRGYGELVDHTGKAVVSSWTYLPSYRWGLTVKQDASEAFALLRLQRQAVGFFMLLAALAVFIVARGVSRSITRPIREAAQMAERVASGDLTARIATESAPGEAGQLLRAVEAMTGDLRSLIGKIQHSSISLMSTATQIAATSRQQGEAVNDYGASTSEAAAAVKEISATSLELLRTMNEVNDVAAHTASMAGEGQGSLTEMGRSMRQLAESTTSISSKLSVISERAAHINLAVTTITKVADQTNLLSINAAIEAEKAGEYGLGFLVVAREIRRLADQTAVATLDIERMVKEMQYSVSAGVMEMDKFSDQVRRGVDEVAQIGDQLGGIIEAVRGLTGRFEQVNEGMRVQSQGAEQIREAVIRLSEGAHQTSISLREFNKATDHLREAVGGLKEEVSRFKVDSVPLSRPAG
ncbi:methyl-accepting chemotaxis protein (plasmid) [Tundrisphaera lichenicola]|uniref:methyl-accepting chemotaxis protein n=1 Tax=Tundrisphaera lichenicola TaxID=2029860 RepID=UPI003EBED050